MKRAYSLLLTSAILLLTLPLGAGNPKQPISSERMTPQTKLLIIRDLTAERAFARTLFPKGKQGLVIKDGKVSPSQNQVARLAMENGFAAHPGDRVVISNVVIKDKAIVFEINGGGKKKDKWYRHVSIGMGGGMAGPPPSPEATGSSVTLAFDKYVPEMTGEQVRSLLAPVFDFKALSEAEAYERTLPPKVQQAIKDHQVLVGMDREMVMYAKGRPWKKVRDKDDTGAPYEEWIYGQPPQEVDFVRFQRNLVSRLEIMTVDGRKIVRTEKEVDLPSQEIEMADKKPEEKPANPPSLLRPGEQAENPGMDSSNDNTSQTPTNLPPPPSTHPPTGAPGGYPGP
ncbi:MAG TPA: hypothetical protein VKV05_10115 [Terriglobales bacterium]|nr:hypothetical protein [Terriglobales bacterium]